MNEKDHGKTGRMRRVPRGFRWLIWTLLIATSLYFGYDATGWILWNRFKAKYEANGVSFDFEDHFITPAPEDDFMQSPTMLGWSKSKDANLTNILTHLPDGVERALQPERGYEYHRPVLFGPILSAEGPLFPEDLALERIHVAMATSDAALKQFAEDAKRPSCWWDDEIPLIPRINVFAQLLELRVRAHLHTGDTDAALNELIGALRFTQHMRNGNTVVGALVQIAVLGILHDSVWEGFRIQAWNDQQLLRLAEEIDQLTVAEDFAMIGVRELAGTIGLIEEMETETYTNSYGSGGWRFSMGCDVLDHFQACPTKEGPWKDSRKLGHLVFETIVPKGHHRLWVYTSGSMWAAMAMGESGELPPRLTEERIVRGEAWDRDSWLCRTFGVGVPHIGKIGEVIIEEQEFYDFARVACELERFWLREGRYPQSLDELPTDAGFPTSSNGRAIEYDLTSDGRYRLKAIEEWRYSPVAED